MVRHYIAVSLYSVVVYAVLSWVPALFIRVHGWTPGETGLRYGSCCCCSAAPARCSAACCQRMLGKRGVAAAGDLDHRRRHGGRVAAARARRMGSTDGWTALAWYAPALLFMTLPGGTAIQVVQEAVPNRLRGQASAIYYLSNSIVGADAGSAVGRPADRLRI